MFCLTLFFPQLLRLCPPHSSPIARFHPSKLSWLSCSPLAERLSSGSTPKHQADPRLPLCAMCEGWVGVQGAPTTLRCASVGTEWLCPNLGSVSFEVHIQRVVMSSCCMKDCPNSLEVKGHSKCALQSTLLLAYLKRASRVHFVHVSIPACSAFCFLFFLKTELLWQKHWHHDNWM